MALERLRVNVAKVLGTNYTVTSLRVSDYNPNIDSTVTLTVTVKDVYNRPVVGDEVAVTASEGNFTKLNGSGITAASTVTGTTDSNGEFTLTYACSEWGLVTFSAKNHNVQISVTGWKQVQTYLTDRLGVYTDGKNGFLRIQGSFNPTSTNYKLETIKECHPIYNKIVIATDAYAGQGQHQNVIRFNTSGEVYLISNGSGTHSVYTSIFYPLANPLY